jgi:hypothetical protein
MIYPNSSKDRETAAYPYVELFRDFAAAVCRPNCTLICFGYSFGDEHINPLGTDHADIRKDGEARPNFFVDWESSRRLANDSGQLSAQASHRSDYLPYG